jgi:hypothetical protein
MYGLKNVRNRRTDALTQVGWDQLEMMLAVYYRGQGYRVEHVGTGASGSRFDGGIDLKLYKDDAYILVQCKHWNAKQVPHNEVHQLIGLMNNEDATGAILVTSGEFTRAAIEAAAKKGQVQLVDGDDLRGMLGALPEPGAAATSTVVPGRLPPVGGLASSVSERLLSAAEDRIRHGGRRWGRESVFAGSAVKTGLALILLKFAFAVFVFVLFWATLQSVVRSLQPATAASTTHRTLPVPGSTPRGGVLSSMKPAGSGAQPEVIDHFSGTTIQDRPKGMPAYRPPTQAEIHEAQRRADEAMRVIEANTPEM